MRGAPCLRVVVAGLPAILDKLQPFSRVDSKDQADFLILQDIQPDLVPLVLADEGVAAI